MRVANAPGMPGTFSPPPRVSDPDMHHGTCVRHVLWCMPGSLTSGWRWKRSRHSGACATHNFMYQETHGKNCRMRGQLLLKHRDGIRIYLHVVIAFDPSWNIVKYHKEIKAYALKIVPLMVYFLGMTSFLFKLSQKAINICIYVLARGWYILNNINVDWAGDLQSVGREHSQRMLICRMLFHWFIDHMFYI